ncbi:MAG: serine/threonine protein kinase [Gammaproteobacteria bacterium]|nr:serine/threonine protein kinase [Gammaproteobacteria bacterium]MDH3506916.1 serine/threonine protein kinase [Gammaproteobacteria bacterium]
MSLCGDDAVTLERRLGRSDVVEVWSATLADLGRCVVKFPAARWSGHAGAARLIERELEFLRRAAHAGVVEALDLVPMRTGPGLVMEYLPGGDLVALAGSHPKHWAGPARDVVRSLAHVHGCGIVHGDVKPRNVLLDAGGHAKLIDFGLARDAGSTSRAGGGTPAYQCSAQWQGAPADPAHDTHALAVMTYELLCGRLPFGSAPDARALETPPVPPLELHPAYEGEPVLVELAALIEMLLTAKADVHDRPLDALEALLGAIIAVHD